MYDSMLIRMHLSSVSSLLPTPRCQVHLPVVSSLLRLSVSRSSMCTKVDSAAAYSGIPACIFFPAGASKHPLPCWTCLLYPGPCYDQQRLPGMPWLFDGNGDSVCQPLSQWGVPCLASYAYHAHWHGLPFGPPAAFHSNCITAAGGDVSTYQIGQHAISV